ncbi:unnamed protein product [Ambrosiozyma monospora]|uniref:Unnamed protein product n=1 Tax=Ambrosiozyma monospora TaxID=43982 RepID=A0ACB5SYH9_AMBMO|nr:unnamed protein product [Ambrosiozyma monospora]
MPTKILTSTSVLLQLVVFAFLITTTVMVIERYYYDDLLETYILGGVSSSLVGFAMTLNSFCFFFQDQVLHIYTTIFTFASLVLTAAFTAKSIKHRTDMSFRYSGWYTYSGFDYYNTVYESIPPNLSWLIWFIIALLVFMVIANYCTYQVFSKMPKIPNLEIHRKIKSVKVCLIANALISIIIFSMSIAVSADVLKWYNYPFLIAAVVLTSLNMIMCVGGYWMKMLLFHVALSLLLPAFFGVVVYYIVWLYFDTWRRKLYIVVSLLIGISELLEISIIVLSVEESRRQSTNFGSLVR